MARNVVFHLRHSGNARLLHFAYHNLSKMWDGHQWGYNLEIGRWVLVARRPHASSSSKFFDLGFGRTLLRNRREEESCSWSGTRHYEGVCGCENKRPRHPKYQGVPDIYLYTDHTGLQFWNVADDDSMDRCALSLNLVVEMAKVGGAPDDYVPTTIFLLKDPS